MYILDIVLSDYHLFPVDAERFTGYTLPNVGRDTKLITLSHPSSTKSPYKHSIYKLPDKWCKVIDNNTEIINLIKIKVYLNDKS